MYPWMAGVHPVYMAKPSLKKVTPRFRRHGKIYLREWRVHRDKTLEQAADFLGMTHASLSRVERGLQPYSEPILEGLADFYDTDKASLLMRDPSDPQGLWSVWDQAKPGERRMIVEMAKTVVKTGT